MPATTDRRRAPRRATEGDLPRILALEHACFQPYRQASRASLRRSLASAGQSVWVLDGAHDRLDALLVLWHHPHRLRVYDVAVHPERQGVSLGLAMMRHAEALAAREGKPVVSLEADPRQPGLVAWYRRQGYAVTARLPAYYKGGRAAVRMQKRVA